MIKDINWMATSIRKSGSVLRAFNFFNKDLRFRTDRSVENKPWCTLLSKECEIVVYFNIVIRFKEKI